MIYGVSFIEVRNPNIWQRFVAFLKRENPNYIVLDPTKIRAVKVKEVDNYGLPNWIKE